MANKILLLLVEGKSDISALEYPLGLYFSCTNPNLDLHFLKPLDGNGDITGSNLIEQSTIAKNIDKWWGVTSYLSKNGFSLSDVVEIVQIIDVDGVYIKDECVKYGPFRNKFEYCEDAIKCEFPQRAIDRNVKKRHNITALKSNSSIKIGSARVNYSIYYFSCNLDHYICGKRNLDPKSKVTKAEEFAYSFDDPLAVYEWFKTSTEDRINVCLDYKKSWEYLKEGNRSLSRCSNLIILLEKYRFEYEEETDLNE